MKKLLVLGLLISLCLPAASYASSIGGAETQGQGKFGIGLDQEFIFDRDMKLKSEEGLDPGDANEGMKSEIDNMYRTMVKASYGVLDNLDIYVKLGTADFKSKNNCTHTEADGDWEKQNDKIKGDNTFAYGFGAKGTYNLKDDWILGCDIQYLRHKNDFKGTRHYGENGQGWDPDDEDSIKGDVTFQEWHIAPYIATKIANFVPYLGIKYSDLRLKQKTEFEDENVEKRKLKANDNFGVFVGTDYKIADNWKLNLEGRFVDETAMSVGATYKF